MGVDAMMYIKLDKPVTEEEFRKKRYIFGQAFSNHLFLGVGETIYNKPLVVKTEFEDYEDRKEFDIRVPLAGRYYGEGYERGSIHIYVAIAEFLEKLFPNCSIFYGGDNSDCLGLFNKEYRDKLIDYFIRVSGRDLYVNGFDAEGSPDAPICPVCEVKMHRNGWGHKYALYTCSGCFWQHVERDGVVTKGFKNG